MNQYAVRIAASAHWSAARRTIRVWADSADNARAEALRHRVAKQFQTPVVVYTRKVSFK
jgi:hypothetical protein